MLVPIFSEIAFAGVTLKSEIKDLKAEVKDGQAEVKQQLATVMNAISVANTNTNTVNVYPAPRDSELPERERQAKAAIAAVGDGSAIKSIIPDLANASAPDDDTVFLITTRRNIDIALRQLAQRWGILTTISVSVLLVKTERRIGSNELLQQLQQAEAIPVTLASAVRDVYAICSAAVHGDPVSPAQVEFVRDVGDDLVATLSKLAA